MRYIIVALIVLFCSPTFACIEEGGEINNYGGQGGAGGNANATAVGGSATATGGSATADGGSVGPISIENGDDNKRPIPNPPGAAGPQALRYYEDNSTEADWRVMSVANFIKQLAEEQGTPYALVDYEEAKRLWQNGAEVVDSLMRAQFKEQKTLRVWTEKPDTKGLRFQGQLPAYAKNGKATTLHCAGGSWMKAMEAGSTDVVLRKEGFRKVGAADGWHIGLGGSITGFLSGDSVGGGMALGPGYTTMESGREDRPFVSFDSFVNIEEVTSKKQ